MIVKMIPAFKDYLWGGTHLKECYGKEFAGDILAESWEFSTHPDGISKVETAHGERLPFPEFLKKLQQGNDCGGDPVGKGWGAEFPLLVKFIDAKKSLSLQVHPDDALAKEYGEKFGKSEMWHILDAQPGAYLYVGFAEDSTSEQLEESIHDNTIETLLNKVEVRPGENYYIQAGTLHAIGPGITLLEIQQKSNLTFRVSDFGRRDKNGKLRELHIPQALRATNYRKMTLSSREERRKDLTTKLFSERRFQVNGEKAIPVPRDSFLGLIAVGGEGSLADDKDRWDVQKGDAFFVPRANANIVATGELDLVTFTL